jgi:hypothetical protein
LEISVIARCARTLLPASSSGGDTTAMPNFPGETAMMPPPTPLFAGSQFSTFRAVTLADRNLDA